MSSTRGRRNALGKRSRRSGAASRKRHPYQQPRDPFDIQHTDKDMMLLISNSNEYSIQVTKRSRRTDETEAAITTDSGWGTVMPLEILHRIFQLLADSEGAVPSLCRLSQVCQRWYQVAASPALWRHVSISVCWTIPTRRDAPSVQKQIQQTMEMLIQKRLSQVSLFELHQWGHHVPFILQNLSTSCPHLTSLTLSHCSRVTTSSLLSVVLQCPQLHSLNLQHSQVESSTVTRILEVCGARLQSLYLTNNHPISTIMNKLAGGLCPELRLIEIDVAIKKTEREFQVSIEALQASCPKLKVLRLLNLLWFPRCAPRRSPECPGFADLRELCLAGATYSIISNDILQRLLRSSRHLRMLDVRGCYKLTAAGICDSPCDDLQCLYMGLYCSEVDACLNSTGSYLLTRRWRHSLQELDLTGQSFITEDLAQALDILARGGTNDTLQSLNLAGTRVTAPSVRQILSSCSALIHLDISSCRNVPRGFKRVYRGAEDLRQCLSALSTIEMN